jgi:capsular polysaccharide biosynthesis protein
MNTKLIAGVCLILCLPVFVVGTYIYSPFLPREYFSHVSLEESSDFYDGVQAFAVKQFQILQSKEIIYPVIDELHLIDKWTTNGQKLPKEQVYFKISKMMVLKEILGTNLIEIGIWSHDPQEAADIANAIALQHQKRRIESERPLIVQGLAELKEEVEKQRIKVERAGEKLTEIRERDHIVDAETSDSNQLAGNQSAAEKQSPDYIKAKSYRLEQKRILEQAESFYETKKIETDQSTVKILEKAEPSVVPGRPNVPLIMLIGSGIGFLFAIIGGVFFLLGLRAQKA